MVILLCIMVCIIGYHGAIVKCLMGYTYSWINNHIKEQISDVSNKVHSNLFFFNCEIYWRYSVQWKLFITECRLEKKITRWSLKSMYLQKWCMVAIKAKTKQKKKQENKNTGETWWRGGLKIKETFTFAKKSPKPPLSHKTWCFDSRASHKSSAVNQTPLSQTTGPAQRY